MTKIEKQEILRVLLNTRKLVCRGAESGFNPNEGLWAEELYSNNWDLTNAIDILMKDDQHNTKYE